MVKRLPTVQETWVQSLGRQDPLEKEMAIHSSTLAWKIPWTEEPGRLHTVHGVAKSQTRLSNFTSHIIQNCISLYFLCFLISAFKIYHSMIKSGINRCCLSISLSPWRNNTLYSTALQNLVQTSIILSFKL